MHILQISKKAEKCILSNNIYLQRSASIQPTTGRKWMYELTNYLYFLYLSQAYGTPSSPSLLNSTPSWQVNCGSALLSTQPGSHSTVQAVPVGISPGLLAITYVFFRRLRVRTDFQKIFLTSNFLNVFSEYFPTFREPFSEHSKIFVAKSQEI